MKLLPRAPLAAHRAQVTHKHKRGLNDDPLGDEQAQTPTPTGPTPPTPKKKKKKKGVRHGSKGSGIGGSKEAAALDSENLLLTNADAGHGAAGIVVTAGDMPYGGLIVYNATDDYSPDTGTGTYRALIDLNGNITITGTLYATAGTISGNLLVTGTLQSSATTNLGYKLSATGFKTWNASNVQTSQILADGSGWLGTSSVFSWTTAGVVSVNGSALVGNTVDADKVTFSAPTISGLTLTSNSPSAGYVAWSSFKLTYQGTTYTVTSGNSNSKYIYWKKATSTTTLQTSASVPTQAADQFIVCINLSGTAYQSNFAPFIYADYIAAGTITSTQLSATAIDAMTITGATIRTASSGARVSQDTTGLFGYGTSTYVFALATGSVTWNGESLSAGDLVLGDTANRNIKLSGGSIYVRSGTSNVTAFDSSGIQTVGALALTPTANTSTGGTLDLDDGTASRMAVGYIRFASLTGALTLRGIATPSNDGQMLAIVNTTAQNVTIKDTGAPAAGYSKITTMSGADETSTGACTATFIYDATSDRWRVLSFKT